MSDYPTTLDINAIQLSDYVRLFDNFGHKCDPVVGFHQIIRQLLISLWMMQHRQRLSSKMSRSFRGLGLSKFDSGFGFVFVAEFPAKLDLAGKLVLPADVLPRQARFGGFSDRTLN